MIFAAVRIKAVVGLAAGLALVSGCGSDTTTTQSSRTTGQTEATTTTAADDNTTEPTETTGADDSGTETTAADNSGTPDPDAFNKCLAVSTSFPLMATAGMGGSDDARARIDAALDQAKSSLPPELTDDFATLAALFKKQAGAGGELSTLDTPEFKKSSTAVETWLKTNCGDLNG